MVIALSSNPVNKFRFMALSRIRLCYSHTPSNQKWRAISCQYCGTHHVLRSRSISKVVCSLFDASALATTSPSIHLFPNPSYSPHFTAISFCNDVGFRDLGALIVRKNSSGIFSRRWISVEDLLIWWLLLARAWHTLGTLSTRTHCIRVSKTGHCPSPVYSLLGTPRGPMTHYVPNCVESISNQTHPDYSWDCACSRS